EQLLVVVQPDPLRLPAELLRQTVLLERHDDLACQGEAERGQQDQRRGEQGRGRQQAAPPRIASLPPAGSGATLLRRQGGPLVGHRRSRCGHDRHSDEASCLVISSSAFLASAATSPPWAMPTNKSSRMRAPSTEAQPCAAGVSLALLTASAVALANSSSPSLSASDSFAGVRPFSAYWVWNSSDRISSTSLRASSLCDDLAEIAMLEPPSSTGAGSPSEPGSGNTPIFFS